MWADPHLNSKFVHIYYSKSFTENLIVHLKTSSHYILLKQKKRKSAVINRYDEINQRKNVNKQNHVTKTFWHSSKQNLFGGPQKTRKIFLYFFFRLTSVVSDEGLGIGHFSYQLYDKIAFPKERFSEVLNTKWKHQGLKTSLYFFIFHITRFHYLVE